MRLAIDASRSVDAFQKTGVEVVSDALLQAMILTAPAGVETAYYTPSRISWLPEAAQQIIPPRLLWTVVGLSRALRRDRPDALFVPVHALPWWLPKKTVRVVHDVSFYRAPEAYAWHQRAYMLLDLWRARRRCGRIVVPTEAVKDDVVRLAGFAPERVVVSGWGLRAPAQLPNATRDTASPFILFVSRVEEKKNVANLIRAFAEFRRTHPTWRLVLAGKPGHGYERLVPLLSEPGVEALGYVTDERKWELLQQASMVAVVSKEEGFGFPLLEAFHAGTPVVASDISVLREIGGEACAYAAPADVGAIAGALSRVAADEAFRGQLVAAGKERLPHYRWNEVAAKVWAAIMAA